MLAGAADDIRAKNGCSIDDLFRGGVQMLTKLLKYEFLSTGRIFCRCI